MKQWRLNQDTKTVIAIDGRDNKPVIIRNYKYLSYYPTLPGNDGEYWLLRTNTNEYFKMKFSEEYKETP